MTEFHVGDLVKINLYSKHGTIEKLAILLEETPVRMWNGSMNQPPRYNTGWKALCDGMIISKANLRFTLLARHQTF
jgi:hypothetical protein